MPINGIMKIIMNNGKLNENTVITCIYLLKGRAKIKKVETHNDINIRHNIGQGTMLHFAK